MRTAPDIVVVRLFALFAVLGSGCYDPAVRDCTVSCAGAGECASDQVCTADHYCAAPSVASCTGPDHDVVPVDAPRASSDGAPPQPDARPDAPAPMVSLHLHMDGKGTIAIDGGPSCTNADCHFPVPPGTSVTVQATGGTDFEFQSWMGGVCAFATTNPQCTFTAVLPDNDVHARFKKDN